MEDPESEKGEQDGLHEPQAPVSAGLCPKRLPPSRIQQSLNLRCSPNDRKDTFQKKENTGG